MAGRFATDHPDKRVRAQQTLAAAIAIRDTPGPLDLDLLDEVLTSAERQEQPIHFAVARALLTRPELGEIRDRVLSVARLAARESTRPETFATDPALERLAKAIRGAPLDKPPTSWWQETVPPPDDHDVPPVVFTDRSEWLLEQGFKEEEWGLSITMFTAGSN